MLSGMKKVLMLFLIPLWIPIAVLYFLLSFILVLPYHLIIYLVTKGYQFGSFSQYLDTWTRLDFQIYRIISHYPHEYIYRSVNSNQFDVRIINCVLVNKDGKHFVFVSAPELMKVAALRDGRLLTFRSGHGATRIEKKRVLDMGLGDYNQYFLNERGLLPDGLYKVTYENVKIDNGCAECIHCHTIRHILNE